jgi:hypothetical protein
MKLLQARVSDDLYFAAKERAAKEKKTLGDFFQDVICSYLRKVAEDESVTATLKDIGKYQTT